MSKSIHQLESELNEMTAKGQILEALEQFYCERCTFEESDGSRRENRQAQHDHLSSFFATLRGFNGATLHAQTLGDDVSMSEWTFDMTGGGGESIVWNEVLVRRWNDGHVVSERFYQAGSGAAACAPPIEPSDLRNRDSDLKLRIEHARLGRAEETTMTSIQRAILSLAVLAIAAAPTAALAVDVAHSTLGAGGYDLVSYRTGEKPVSGNGNHLSVHEGVTYLFQNQENKATFEADPAHFVPAYGGYCAYGTAVGKKFVGDPTVWEIVDDRLYLNLDNKIKGLWRKDIPGHIEKANANWRRIRNVPAADL